MTRKEFLDLDDWSLVNVFFRPDTNADNPDRGYWPVPRGDADDPAVRSMNWRQVFYGPRNERLTAMRTVGMSDEEIETKFQNFIKSMHR